jgi:hypothetical protein
MVSTQHPFLFRRYRTGNMKLNSLLPILHPSIGFLVHANHNPPIPLPFTVVKEREAPVKESIDNAVVMAIEESVISQTVQLIDEIDTSEKPVTVYERPNYKNGKKQNVSTYSNDEPPYSYLDFTPKGFIDVASSASAVAGVASKKTKTSGNATKKVSSNGGATKKLSGNKNATNGKASKKKTSGGKAKASKSLAPSQAPSQSNGSSEPSQSPSQSSAPSSSSQPSTSPSQSVRKVILPLVSWILTKL